MRVSTLCRFRPIPRAVMRCGALRVLASSVAAFTVAVVAVLGLPEPARAEILPVPAIAQNRFGRGVAVAELGSGLRVIAVGSPNVPGVVVASRKVQVFLERDGDAFPVYIEEASLTNPSADAPTADFGVVLAMRRAADGSVLLAVGAPAESSSRGAVHLFRRTNLGVWTAVQSLVAPVRRAGDFFGSSIAISQDLKLIAIGADRTEVAGVSAAGAVHAFKLVSGSYQHSATASSPIAPTTAARVGAAVAIPTLPAGQKPEILVGAGEILGQGLLHVLRENVPGTWLRVATITPPAGTTGVGFGSALAASGTRAVVGMSDSNSPGNLGRGTAFALRRVQGVWSIDAELPFGGPIAATANLGSAVSMEGTTIAVGSTRGDAVHVFRRGASGAWHQVERVVPTTTEGPATGVQFGSSIALSGGLLVVGSPGRSNFSQAASGAVALFEIDPQRLSSSTPSSASRFGAACAVNGARAAMSALRDVVTTSSEPFREGSVRVMNLIDGVWQQEADLDNPRTTAGFSDYARRIAMPSPDLVVVSASNQTVDGGGSGRGVVYFYERAAPGVWARSDLETPESGFSNFGVGLASIMDGALPLTAIGTNSIVDAGRVHIVLGTQIVQTLENPSPGTGDSFGSSLAMQRYANGTIDLWVGAPGADTAAGSDSGSITLFRRAPGAADFALVQADRVLPGTQQAEGLGEYLAMRGSMLVVASPGRAPTATAGQGMARVLTRNAAGTWSVASGSIRSAPGTECAVNVATNGSLIAVAVAGPGEVARVARVANGSLQFVRSFLRPANFNGTNASSVFTGIALSSGVSPFLLVGDSPQNNGDRDQCGAVYSFFDVVP